MCIHLHENRIFHRDNNINPFCKKKSEKNRIKYKRLYMWGFVIRHDGRKYFPTTSVYITKNKIMS